MVELAEVALIAVVWIPPANVEVAVEVEVSTPVVSLPMLEEERNESTSRAMVAKKVVVVALVERRLVNVEVAEEVAVMTPAVKFPTDDDETASLTVLKNGV